MLCLDTLALNASTPLPLHEFHQSLGANFSLVSSSPLNRESTKVRMALRFTSKANRSPRSPATRLSHSTGSMRASLMTAQNTAIATNAIDDATPYLVCYAF